MKRFWPFLAFAAVALGITLAPFVLSGCGELESGNVVSLPTEPTENAYSVQKIVEVLQIENATTADSLYLARVPGEMWPQVVQWIEERHISFAFEDESRAMVAEPMSLASPACAWAGSTRRDYDLCQANGYNFQGHHAVYFIVDANANCYNKDLDWWVAQCVLPQWGGCVSNWDLFLASGAYWHAGLQKWVKNVVLLVPTSWWTGYYMHWPADFKASRFLLSWNPTPNGCCE